LIAVSSSGSLFDVVTNEDIGHAHDGAPVVAIRTVASIATT
jgi:hypothetical protein